MSIKNKIKHYVGKYPDIFFPLYRAVAPLNHVTECLLRNNDEICIEGFPRSANTFAVVAFRHAQNRDVPMGHHLHIESQILLAVRMGIPVIVLLREPASAIRSLLIRHPGTDVKWAIKRYVEFYFAVESVVDDVVIADFKDVISDFGKIISTVNKKFGTSFSIFEHSHENVEEVYLQIELINKVIDGGKETHVARPSADRKKMKVDMNFYETLPIMHAAENIYQKLCGINFPIK